MSGRIFRRNQPPVGFTRAEAILATPAPTSLPVTRLACHYGIPQAFPSALLNGTQYGVRRVTVGEDEKWGRVRRHGEHDQRLPRNGRRPGVGSVFTVTVADGGDRLAQSRFRTVWYQHDLAPSPAKT